MEYAVYRIFVFNGQLVYEMLYCDVSLELGNSIVEVLEKRHPEHIYFAGEIMKEHIQFFLN